MNEEEWCRACRTTAEAQARWSITAITLRDALAALGSLMQEAPWSVRSAYAELREDELNSQARTHVRTMDEDGFGWIHKAVGWRRSLKALAVQIRAVDAMLAEWSTRGSRPPARTGREWRTSDGSAYVIPARRPRDMGSSRGDGLPFARRGTIHHRVVPTEVDGMPVLPVLIDAPRLHDDPTRLRLGAAFFPGLGLTPIGTGSGFRASCVGHDDMPAQFAEHLRRMTEVDVAVWPELTIDDDSLETIAASLARRAIKGDTRPGLTVAGSWHRPRTADGDIANVAPILDANGVWKAEHVKIVRYRHPELGLEDVATGNRMLILVCDDFLASVAICKDHCDIGEHPPWGRLDVDLVLVPSMGNATTMAGHLHHAGGNRIHAGTRTMVAQQGVPTKPEEARGFVLLAPLNPPSDPALTRFDGIWSEGSLPKTRDLPKDGNLSES